MWPGPSLPKSALLWSVLMNTRSSALRSELPKPNTGALGLRESCCSPNIERPLASGIVADGVARADA